MIWSMFINQEIVRMDFFTIIRRVRDAYRILIGKSRAYHYWEDENE